MTMKKLDLLNGVLEDLRNEDYSIIATTKEIMDLAEETKDCDLKLAIIEEGYAICE